jgi:ferritin-like metal-binding protein YciE
MSENNQPIVTLHDLLDYEAGKFTSEEIQLKSALHEWINKASSLKLKAVLQKYLDYVEQHLQKMESFFEEEKFTSISLTNPIIHVFIEETNNKLSKCGKPAVKDACLLASVQAINHFKICSYGTSAAFANTLEMGKHAAVFHEAEVNEKQIDDRLSQLAEHEINPMAKTPIELER